MEPISYQRIIGKGSGRRSQSARCRGRGFRLNSRRFSVSKLRAKFMCLLRILNRWRRSIKKERRSKASAAEVAEFPRCADRLRSFRRSNSFYAEAIADCLDFIKTNSSSLAVDETRVEFRHPSP